MVGILQIKLPVLSDLFNIATFLVAVGQACTLKICLFIPYFTKKTVVDLKKCAVKISWLVNITT